MSVFGLALVRSTILSSLIRSALPGESSGTRILAVLVVVSGAASALVMNDTVAIIGAPLVITIARSCGVSPRPFLYALAFSVTTGSILSPIGSPQALIIANSGMGSPFAVFFRHLAVPTILSLGLVGAVVAIRWREVYRIRAQVPPVVDAHLTPRHQQAVLVAAAALVAMICSKVALVSLGGPQVPLVAIAVVPVVPLLVLSPQRAGLVKGADWRMLAFFASLFVVMRGVWEVELIHEYLVPSPGAGATRIMLEAGVMSQVLSNVPYVALVVPSFAAAGDAALMALAAGSTLAGNMLLLGAASNVIIAQQAELYGESLPFSEFLRVGLPLSLAQICVYALFL